MMSKIKILDCTLREGEQSQNTCFSVVEKITIANKLKDFGVDVIEIGHPGISKQEELNCAKIIENVKDIDILVHSRALVEDVEAAAKTNAQWIGIWTSFNDISLSSKFNNKSRGWIKGQVKKTVTLAKDFGFKIRFSIEDASRTPLEQILNLATTAIQAGADRISLTDSVGAWHPQECYDIVKAVKSKLNCEIEVHLHNDLGLAQANAISAIQAGATVIDTSILGIGERAGICDLIPLAKSLDKFYDVKKFNFKLSQELADMISRVSCFNIEPHHPLVGRNVFTHTSKYHAKATKNNPKAYEIIDPSEFGEQRKIIVNELNRTETQRINDNLEVKIPFIKGASELLHHRDGVGARWVFMDSRIDPRSQIYIIERIFDKDYSTSYESHVDSHAHNCDSTFVFMGNNTDGTGLKVSVTFGEDAQKTTKIIQSPASVYIPANVYHSYSYISGTGRFLNFVLSPNYNQSIVNRTVTN
ncbi:2-isopropylmalate synthase [Allofrancisella frigidaquae]|uniref:Homocitrate synthase n=2 Tax=Allofrancisella frigidaquae TaxID=1085644 RepID=A0A6M3HX03_9GAMM|nr:2-isopropylmalate synthase [Allofrancisella frigidaquae]